MMATNDNSQEMKTTTTPIENSVKENLEEKGQPKKQNYKKLIPQRTILLKKKFHHIKILQPKNKKNLILLPMVLNKKLLKLNESIKQQKEEEKCVFLYFLLLGIEKEMLVLEWENLLKSLMQ